ncbi:hypothetical protein D6C76_03790, partial [Aureobasidium pullulans]
LLPQDGSPKQDGRTETSRRHGPKRSQISYSDPFPFNGSCHIRRYQRCSLRFPSPFILVTHGALIINNSYSPAVHPSTNTSPHAPRSAVVFPRTQHRVATGQSDRILLLESIEDIKICPQWALRSSLDWASLPLEHQLVGIFNLCSSQIARAASLRTQSLTANLTVSPSCFYMIPTAHKTDKVLQMSQELHVEVKDFVNGLYDKLCKSHGVTPTVHEVQMIRRSIGALSKNKLSFVEPALLFFLPMSSLQYEMDSLLIGWIDQSDGSKKGIWFKVFENYPRVYNRCGGPTGSLHTPGRYVCDEWVPALDEVLYLDECQSRTVQYAYYISDPEIENSTTIHREQTFAKQEIVVDWQSKRDEKQKEKTPCESKRVATIDLTGSDSEQDVEPQSELKPEPTSSPLRRSGAQPRHFSTLTQLEPKPPSPENQYTTSLRMKRKIKEKMTERRRKLQLHPPIKISPLKSHNRRRNCGRCLPSWIEELVREELDQKTLRELKSAKNWLR